MKEYNQNQTITCPHCKHLIRIDEALYSKIQEEFQTKFDKKSLDLKKEKELIEKLKSEVNEEIQKGVNTKLSAEKTKLIKTLRQEIESEKEDELTLLQESLKEKSAQVKELNKTKAIITQLQLEKEELKGKIEAEQAEKFGNLLTIEMEKVKNLEGEKNKTEMQKLQKIIDDQKKQLEDSQRKLENSTSSNKLTGEIKEIQLRDYLKEAFIFDLISDITSEGADVFQEIRNNMGQHSGSIIFERKHTQTFNKDWIFKLKEDGRRVKADVCVLVTKALPKDNPKTHYNNGVWICAPSDVEIICALLRDGLIKQYAALSSQDNRSGKAELIYSYLCSSDFQNTILAILDAFKKMDKSLTKDKEDSLKRFSEREAHIFQAKQSIISFWGRVDGITSDLLSQEVKSLTISAS